LLLTEAATINVNCNTGSLQTAINGAKSGDIISVTGTCNENVFIYKNNITLDGGGTATIKGPDATNSTIYVYGNRVTIKGFTISGGFEGISILVNSNATIDSNTIENTHHGGIIVVQNSFATIVNNTIRNNPNHGIVVSDTSSAFIGFTSPFPDVTVASPNTIEDNGSNGIQVWRSSSARIVGNTIRNNDGNGITVARVSHADISDNTIDGNGQNGIYVTQNSGVNLGSDTGTTIFNLPNTTTVNNGDKGLRCSIGGYMDGRRGTLNGARGRVGHDDTCIDSLVR
jgi:parallel beta-helix repeat protein